MSKIDLNNISFFFFWILDFFLENTHSKLSFTLDDHITLSIPHSTSSSLFLVSHLMFDIYIKVRLYPNLCHVEFYLGWIISYQGFFHSQSSNPTPLVKRGTALSAAQHPLVISFYFFHLIYLHKEERKKVFKIVSLSETI